MNNTEQTVRGVMDLLKTGPKHLRELHWRLVVDKNAMVTEEGVQRVLDALTSSGHIVVIKRAYSAIPLYKLKGKK